MPAYRNKIFIYAAFLASVFRAEVALSQTNELTVGGAVFSQAGSSSADSAASENPRQDSRAGAAVTAAPSPSDGYSIPPPPELNSGQGTKPTSGFVNSEHLKRFINDLSTTSRQTSNQGSKIQGAVKRVLDLRLPMIDRECDIDTSHEFIKLGYAYYADFPGAEAQLRSTADTLVNKKMQEIRSVTPKCRVALRGFAVAVMQVYYGVDWSNDEEQNLRRAADSVEKPVDIRRPAPGGPAVGVGADGR